MRRIRKSVAFCTETSTRSCWLRPQKLVSSSANSPARPPARNRAARQLTQRGRGPYAEGGGGAGAAPGRAEGAASVEAEDGRGLGQRARAAGERKARLEPPVLRLRSGAERWAATAERGAATRRPQPSAAAASKRAHRAAEGPRREARRAGRGRGRGEGEVLPGRDLVRGPPATRGAHGASRHAAALEGLDAHHHLALAPRRALPQPAQPRGGRRGRGGERRDRGVGVHEVKGAGGLRGARGARQRMRRRCGGCRGPPTTQGAPSPPP